MLEWSKSNAAFYKKLAEGEKLELNEGRRSRREGVGWGCSHRFFDKKLCCSHKFLKIGKGLFDLSPLHVYSARHYSQHKARELFYRLLWSTNMNVSHLAQSSIAPHTRKYAPASL